MDRKEAQKTLYRGREYNAYEATQKQRQMETAIRAQRQKAQLLKQGGADSDDILNARCKYQAMLDEYKEFSGKFNLPEQSERIYADLRGRVAPSQQTCKAWKAEQADKAAKRTAAKERKAECAMREKAENNRRADMDKAAESGIMNASKAKEEIDYIFKDKKENTALVCKGLIDDGKYVNIVLRLVTSKDASGYKNSIITAIGENEKRFTQRLRNNKPLYKKE